MRHISIFIAQHYHSISRIQLKYTLKLFAKASRLCKLHAYYSKIYYAVHITYIVGVGRRAAQCSSESYIDPEIGGISTLERGRIQSHLPNLTNKFYAGDKCPCIYTPASKS